MPTLCAQVAYQGTDFSGWQRQDGQRTVQACIETALAQVARVPVAVRGAGRTDAGVHARGQLLSFFWQHKLSADRLLLALAALLPADISVSRLHEVAEGFDAKRDSIGKCYVYRIFNARYRPVLERHYTWHRRHPLDVDAMQAAAQVLVGELDFESFRSAGCQAQHAHRCVWKVAVTHVDNLISIEVRGNAFVRGMVRAMAGTLVDIGGHRWPVAYMHDIVQARSRSAAGVHAPAHGLVLEQVYLREDLQRAEIPEWARWPGFRDIDEKLGHG